jgi:polyhydroxyalkanoate synthesis regulator phasin
MAGAADANKVQEVLKELDKHYAKEIAILKQTIAKLEQRVASLEKPQTPKQS